MGALITIHRHFIGCAMNTKSKFLPPNLSNQTQTLDLVVFHLHKEQIRKYIKLENDDSLLAEKLKKLYSTFQSIATLGSIQASFEAAGAVYEKSDSLIPIVYFDRAFATHLLSNPKTKKEKKEMSRARKGLDLQDHESRLKISDIQSYWKNDDSGKERIAKVMEKVPMVVDPTRAPPSPMNRLLQAFLPVDEVENSQFYPEQPKGRPKKQKQDEKQPSDGPIAEHLDFDGKSYLELDINERLEYELIAAGIVEE